MRMATAKRMESPWLVEYSHFRIMATGATVLST